MTAINLILEIYSVNKKTKHKMKRSIIVVQFLIMFILTLFVMSQIKAQDMEGFDPNAKPVPDFKLTPFYETKLEYVGKKQGDLLKTELIQAPEGALAWRVMYVSRT